MRERGTAAGRNACPRPLATLITMDREKTGASQPVAKLPRSQHPGVIEWNVDMRVTVSNAKRSKILQRSSGIVLLILAIAFAVVLSHLKREIRALQVQMQCVNVNLLVLMSKYDKLNRSLNRAWHHGANRYYENGHGGNIRRLIEGASLTTKTSEILDSVHSAYHGSSYAYNSISPLLKPVINLKEKLLLSNGRDSAKETNSVIAIEEPRATSEDAVDDLDDDSKGNNLRIERAILTFEAQNATKDLTLDREPDAHDAQDDVEDVDEEVNRPKEPRSGRSRRDEGRGKKRGKNKWRPKRSRRRLGPLVATFVGAIPEQHITDMVYVGPWVKSAKTDHQYSFNRFHLVEDKKSIEVTMTGLYMISAQIFYFGESVNYSYWILVTSEGKSATQRLVKCSTVSSTTATEVSCYTSITTFLRRGDRLHIQQQERDRLINMREGYSYIQLVLLSNNSSKRRLT